MHSRVIVDLVRDVDLAEGRRQMVDGIATTDGIADIRLIGYRTEMHFGSQALQFIQHDALLIVENNTLIALAEHVFHQMGPGKTGSACNEYFHKFSTC